MKKLLIIILIFKVFQCQGQAIVKGSIELKDSTINRTITFTVPKGTTKFDYSAKGYLTQGMLFLVVMTPGGKQDGGFQLSCSPNKHGGTEPSKGELENNVRSPVPGVWRLYIRVDKGSGRLSYQVNLTTL
jgi:hypothetical protein